MANLFSDFVLDLGYGDVPDHVRSMAGTCLADLIGVAAAGHDTDLSRIIRTHAVRQFGGGPVALWFDGRGVSAAGAALANGMTIDAFDAHDGHPLTKGHAGCGALPALMAVWTDAGHEDGAEFLAALVVGYEVAIRAGMTLHRSVPDYHTSGAWVALAAAGIGARVLGLTPAQLAHAIGIAEYHGPRSQMMRCIDHPTMVKDGSGWGAMAGVSAAFLAADGFTGAPAITVTADDQADLWTDLGSRWRIMEQYFKPYPVCRWAQPATEAVLGLIQTHGIGTKDIAQIRIHSFHEAIRLATRSPATTEEAQYSLPFPVAAAAVHRTLGAAQIMGDLLHDPEVLRLSKGMALIEDTGCNALFPAERWARAEIVLADGRTLSSPLTQARGDADSPLSTAELRGKATSLLSALAGVGRASAVLEAIDALPDGGTAPLFNAISAPVSAS